MDKRVKDQRISNITERPNAADKPHTDFFINPRPNPRPNPPPPEEEKEEEEGDLSHYSDNDLFQLLDLNNPSDRELEAKLYSLINKYNQIKTKIGQQLKRFYINIFNHFFETEDSDDEEDDTEGFETKKSDTKEDTTTKKDEKPAYTKSLDYTKGSLNPILKETVKRVVSIDSSFRNTTTYPYSTDFTFNLSETLRDIVSLKLYSVSIPYNWYTINQNYGSNFFYIKGNSNGINNGNFDYKISIPYGNYTAPSLISAVNDSIQTNLINVNPDISFGTTQLDYNSVNGRCTLTLDIMNVYNETNYSLYFPISNFSNNATKNSIPELFGYINGSYNPFTIYSNISIFTPTTPYTNNNNYTLTSTNNYFTINIYQASVSFNSGLNTNIISSYDESKILHSIQVKLSLPTGSSPSGTQIFADLNTQLANSQDLIQSYSSSINTSENMLSSMISVVEASSEYVNNYFPQNSHKFALNLRPNRKTTSNVPNQKMVVVFPDETSINSPIWTGPTSLFNFPSQTMEVQNEYSELNSYTTTYIVNTSPFIILKCIAVGYGIFANLGEQLNNGLYDISLNDYKIEIPNSPDNGYILSQYYNAIQSSFDNLNTASNGQVVGTIDNKNNNYYTDLTFSIKKVITTENFYLDVSNSFLTTLGLSIPTINGNDGTITFSVENIQSFTINNDNNTFFIHPSSISSGDNQYMEIAEVSINTGNFNISDLVNSINDVFNTYSSNNMNLSGTSLVYSIVNGSTINFSLTVNVQAVLKNKDYVLYFFDASSRNTDPPAKDVDVPENEYYAYHYTYAPYTGFPDCYYWYYHTDNDISGNSWRRNLGFLDPSYSLTPPTTSNTNTTVVSGTIQNVSNLLNLTSENNYFQLKPIYDPSGGVYDGDSTITYTLDLNTGSLYSKEQIRDSINRALNKTGSIAIGSYVDTSNPNTIIRLNVNNIFSAKDYSVIFYDPAGFNQCNYGPRSSAEATTSDTTLGWKIGFRTNVVYDLTPGNLSTNSISGVTYYGDYIANSYTYNPTTRIAAITGDTSVNVNLYNYFLIILDDYTQNHLNDGLVTTVTADIDVPLPSYATKSSYRCVVGTEQYAVSNTSSSTNYNKLTNAQIYSANQILTNQQTKYLGNTLSSGPFIQDIFGIIPVKTAGLSYGQTYAEFGGTLQIQERVYFGPVNISRMTVRIMTDKGNILDLNNQNWSFSLITEQLYNPNKG